VQWQLVTDARQTWTEETGLNPDSLALKPEDLGVRMTYVASGPITESSDPHRDFAVPYAPAVL
jgi:hypothetical protein